MEERLSHGRRAEIIAVFESRSILVFGDLMVDEYLHGAARRISQEGPVMVVQIVSDEFKPGGAANVGNNLRALGARVAMAGVVGEDEMGALLKRELGRWNVDTSAIVTDPSRPTTRKTRIVAQSQQVLRVDREQTGPVGDTVARSLLESAERLMPNVDGVLVSDYRKGVITEETARAVSEMARAQGKPLITNPKPSSARWLAGARVMSLNQIEAEELGGAPIPDEERSLREYGKRLAELVDVDTLVVTLGSRGLCLFMRGGEVARIHAHVVEVADIAGAGDTTIGTMALAMVAGASDVEAAELANLAGACVVRKHGVATVSPEELINAI